MDYDPGLYKKTAADTSGPGQLLIDILRKHLAKNPAEKIVDHHGYVQLNVA